MIQNLGPGDLYLDWRDDVTAADGFKVASGTGYEFPGDIPKALYAVATTAGTDVRILVVG